MVTILDSDFSYSIIPMVIVKLLIESKNEFNCQYID
jgi:hypothetical protein